MHISRSVAAAAAVLLAACSTTPLPPAAELLERASGVNGMWNFAPGDQGRVVYETSILGETLRMDYRWAGADRLRVRSATSEGDIVVGRNGDLFWMVHPEEGASLLTEEELKEHAGAFSGDGDRLDLSNFRSAETVERAEVEGVPCYRVKVVDKKGAESRHCLAVDTGLLVETVAWSGPGNAGLQATLRLLDYRKVGRHQVPGRIVTRVLGQELAVTLREASTAPQPDSAFAVPAEVQALAAR